MKNSEAVSSRVTKKIKKQINEIVRTEKRKKGAVIRMLIEEALIARVVKESV